LIRVKFFDENMKDTGTVEEVVRTGNPNKKVIVYEVNVMGTPDEQMRLRGGAGRAVANVKEEGQGFPPLPLPNLQTFKTPTSDYTPKEANIPKFKADENIPKIDNPKGYTPKYDSPPPKPGPPPNIYTGTTSTMTMCHNGNMNYFDKSDANKVGTWLKANPRYTLNFEADGFGGKFDNWSSNSGTKDANGNPMSQEQKMTNWFNNMKTYVEKTYGKEVADRMKLHLNNPRGKGVIMRPSI
jgi:hypothetical protein